MLKPDPRAQAPGHADQGGDKGLVSVSHADLGFFSKNRGGYPEMDGENSGKSYEQMDDVGGKPTIFGNTHLGGGNSRIFGIFTPILLERNDSHFDFCIFFRLVW